MHVLKSTKGEIIDNCYLTLEADRMKWKIKSDFSAGFLAC